MNTATLWEEYRQHGDLTAREQLLSQNLRLVRHIARQTARSLRGDVEFDDLVSAGTMGLVNAIENFEPARGLAFSTFAAPRIRGAILDDLRRWDHAPRSVRRKQRQINTARETLRARLDREPQDTELANEMGIDLEQLWRWQSDTQDAVQVSIDQPVEGAPADFARTPLEFLVVNDAETTENRLSHEQEVAILQKEIMALKERERLVLTLYYYEGLKLHEIASIVGLTESRISQIRSKTLAGLRERLRPLREELV
jgi:RNA polymerase sigma factor for flagellar operon FliA